MGIFFNFWQSYLLATRSYFSFRMITWVNINVFSPNLVCVFILWRFGLGLLMGNFHQFLKELSAHKTSVFSFQDNNGSKSQWIVTKVDMCIDTAEIWFGIANRQFSIFICLRHDNGGMLSFHVFILWFLLNRPCGLSYLQRLVAAGFRLPLHYENTPIQIYWRFTTKKGKFSDKTKSDFFLYSCSKHTVWVLVNECPQSMFLSRNKKNNVYHCKPQFYYIEVGFKVVKII